MQQSLPFKKEFLDQSRMYFEGASLHSVDFGRTEEARQAINRWVEQQTRDRIRDLFARGTLSKENRLVVANAVYFKSRWADPFPKGATKDEPFHVTDDSFSEDRHVLTSHRGAAVMSLLRQAALNLLRGRCALWSLEEPLTGRAQRVCARPLAVLPVPSGL